MDKEGFCVLLFRCPLTTLPLILLLGQVLMSRVLQSCLSPFYKTDGFSLIIWIPLIFGEASANFGMKSSGNILWEARRHGWKRT
jgi:hypothetical protein